MSLPISPTLIGIVTEALNKVGWSDPVNDTNAPYTRARDIWMEEIKNDIILGGKTLKSLETERVFALTDGKNKYAQPSDYLLNKSIEILDGTHQNTATDGASGSITFASNEDATDVMGREIMITSGTGVNQLSFCYSYNSLNKIASVTPLWVAPNTTSKYMIVSSYYPIDLVVTKQPISTIAESIPTGYYLNDNNTNGDIIFNPVPYKNVSGKVYAVKQRYYADLMEIDLAGSLMATLYQKWRALWLAGLFYKALQTSDDDRQETAKKMYYDMLAFVIKNEVILVT